MVAPYSASPLPIKDLWLFSLVCHHVNCVFVITLIVCLCIWCDVLNNLIIQHDLQQNHSCTTITKLVWKTTPLLHTHTHSLALKMKSVTQSQMLTPWFTEKRDYSKRSIEDYSKHTGEINVNILNRLQSCRHFSKTHTAFKGMFRVKNKLSFNDRIRDMLSIAKRIVPSVCKTKGHDGIGQKTVESTLYVILFQMSHYMSYDNKIICKSCLFKVFSRLL